MSGDEFEALRDRLNEALHFGAKPCRSACTHVLVDPWTALGAANVLARQTMRDQEADRAR